VKKAQQRLYFLLPAEEVQSTTGAADATVIESALCTSIVCFGSATKSEDYRGRFRLLRVHPYTPPHSP